MKKIVLFFIMIFSLKGNAQIVYVDVSPDSCICLSMPPSSIPATYSLSSLWDFDHDGTNDFKIQVEISGSVDCEHESYFTYLLSLGSNQVIGNSSGILKLNTGDTINNQSNWGSSSQLEYFNGYTGWTGNWWIDTSGFVGIKFNSGVTTYYGWINLIVDAQCNTARVVVKDYAYSTSLITAGEGETTAIKEYKTQQNFVVYPNPNNGNFVIEPNGNAKQTVQVYDVNGKLVLSQIIEGKTNIDASTLNEGVYNISIVSTEGVLNKRLVIVR